MADLIVRNLEDAVVKRLREVAARDGVSAEEAHRRLLRRTLLADSDGRRMTLKEYLLTMPEFGEDESELLNTYRTSSITDDWVTHTFFIPAQ